MGAPGHGAEGLEEKPCYLLSGEKKSVSPLPESSAMKPKPPLRRALFPPRLPWNPGSPETHVRLHREGHTLAVTTHDVEKVIAHVSRMAILHGGELRELGPPGDLIPKLEHLGVLSPLLFDLGKREALMAQRMMLHYFPGIPVFTAGTRGANSSASSLLRQPRSTQNRMARYRFSPCPRLFLLSRLPLKSFLRGPLAVDDPSSGSLPFQIVFTPAGPSSAFHGSPSARKGFASEAHLLSMALLLCCGTLFTAVTRPGIFRTPSSGFSSLFRSSRAPNRAHGFPHARFFTLILDQAEEVRLALKTRLGDRSRNPFRRAKYMALPIIRRSLFRAEDVTLALAARGYRDDIPLSLLPAPYPDGPGLATSYSFLMLR